MDTLTLLASVGSALVSGGVATAVTSRLVTRREQHSAADEAARTREHERLVRTKVESRLTQTQAEVEQLRRLNLVLEGPPAPDRAQRRHLDSLTRLLQGFAFIDAVVIADAAGLALSCGGSPLDTDLAAAVPVVQDVVERVRLLGLPASEVRVVLRDQLHVVARPLPEWTGGAWLLAAATSQFPNPLAIAATMARAELGTFATSVAGRTRSLRGTDARVGDRGASSASMLEELEALTRSCQASLVLLGLASKTLLAVHRDGPTVETGEALFTALDRLRERITTRLRQPVEQISMLSPAGCAHLHLLAGSMRLFIVGPDAQLDPLTIPRLGGRIKRLVATSTGLASEVSP